MAFLELRRFTFFDVHKNVDNGKIAECLQDTTVSVATSGNNHVILCDVTGWAHLISGTWEITSFKAYELTVTLAQQLPHDPFLITIGEDETTNPLIRVWDWSRSDRHGNPICTRVSRAIPSHMRPTQPTALAVHENKNLMAVGFQDGSVSLFRGNIARQRSGKMKTLPDTGTIPIIALAFQGSDKLFIVSRSSILVSNFDSGRCVTLDTEKIPRCAAMAANTLSVATKEAIFCYTTEGRGPCYALEGEKVRLDWFRSYLVITTIDNYSVTASSSNAPTPKAHHITILDIKNKFIVFSKTFDEIDAVLTEWGSFYILTKNKEMIYLDEKDLQSKLTLLFKKNLYDVAIQIASSQHYDIEGLMEIHKQYGDHLYSKGDLKGAIDQYVKTIGWLETSYVIRKYLEARVLEPLVQYLEELHKKGLATEDHTTLLLTCYVKIDQHDQQGKLKEFLHSKEEALNFDIDVAIKVVRQVSVDDALSLAATNKCHDWYLKLMIEDKKDYKKALDYIADLEFDEADLYMKKYGHNLVQHEPEECVKFLKLLCTDYKPRNAPLVDESTLSGNYREPNKGLAEEYIHLLVCDSRRLISLLEYVVAVESNCSPVIYNTLVQHYIHVWAKSGANEKAEYEDKIMKLLKSSDANYDKDQTLIVCQMLGFKPGIVYLYEENKLWRSLVALHLRSKDAESAFEVCKKRGAICPNTWLDLLWSAPPVNILPRLLSVVAAEKLLSPILVIDCLTSTPSYTLGDVRTYLMNVLKSETDVITREQELAEKYRSESIKMKAQIQTLQNEAVTFQSSRCAACNRQLELPTVHFLCQHSFHQHCFQSYSESERECPACAPQRRRPDPANVAEHLHGRLTADADPYAVVSEYFGRGLFNKVTVITEPEPPSISAAPVAPAPAKTPAPSASNYGPGAEAKLRLQEGQTKQVYISNTTKQVPSKGTSIIPVPEGRMRLIEQQQYSSSLEANLTHIEPQIHKKSPLSHRKQDDSIASGMSPSTKTNGANVGPSKNPFEEENYDESKNPFAEEEDNDPTNPFADNDDYDKNLNPFS